MATTESELGDSCIGHRIPTAAVAIVSAALNYSVLKFYGLLNIVIGRMVAVQPPQESPNITFYRGRTVAVEQM